MQTQYIFPDKINHGFEIDFLFLSHLKRSSACEGEIKEKTLTAALLCLSTKSALISSVECMCVRCLLMFEFGPLHPAAFFFLNSRHSLVDLLKTISPLFSLLGASSVHFGSQQEPGVRFDSGYDAHNSPFQSFDSFFFRFLLLSPFHSISQFSPFSHLDILVLFDPVITTFGVRYGCVYVDICECMSMMKPAEPLSSIHNPS